jgi:hypothetical protein
MNPNKWIINSWIDVLFVCGGMVWFLALASQLAGYEDSIAKIAIAAHLFSETHIAATLRKIYGSLETIKANALYTVWLPLLAIPISAAALAIPMFLGSLLKAYLLWLIYHFLAQTYGIILLYYYKWNYAPSGFDKITLRLFLYAVAAKVIVSQLLTSTSQSMSFLGLELPAWPPLSSLFMDIAQLTVCIYGLLLIFAVMYKATFESKIPPLPVMLILLTVVTAFCLQSKLQGLFWFYLPAFYHGSQYLAVTVSQYLRERNFDIRNGGSEMSNEVLNYYLSLLLIAVTIYIGVPQVLRLAGIEYNLGFATVFALVGLHHFLTDQAIWKLRHTRVARSLV